MLREEAKKRQLAGLKRGDFPVTGPIRERENLNEVNHLHFESGVRPQLTVSVREAASGNGINELKGEAAEIAYRISTGSGFG